MIFEKYLDQAQIALWLKKNFYILLGLLVAAFIGGLAEIGRRELLKKRTSQIQDELYSQKQAFKLLIEKSKKTEGEKPPSSEGNQIPLAGEEKSPPFIKWTEELRQSASLYETKIRENHKNISAIPFAISLADIYSQTGEIEKAKSLLLLFAFPDRSSSLYHLASFQLSSYYAEAGECEKALSLLTELSSNLKASAFHLEAGLREALCLEDLNRPQEAKDRYEKISIQDPEGYVGRLAEDYRKLLILSEKLEGKQ